ncbi:hypothetical protein JCM3775_007338 [Rhodotorula graminis]
MVDVAPAFLPLQPLSMSYGTALASPLSPLELGEALAPWSASANSSTATAAASCSLEALRASLALPLHLPRRPRPSVELVTRPVPDEQAANGEVDAGIVVRQLRRADVERVRKLQDECLPVSYPPSFYTVLLTSPTSICLVSHSSSSPSSLLLGCVSAHLSYPPPCTLSSRTADPPRPSVYLLSLVVDPAARGRGLAAHLVRSACRALLPPTPCHDDAARRTVKLSLHVEATNAVALRMYRRLGLDERRRQRGFYSRLRGGGTGEAVEMVGIIEV